MPAQPGTRVPAYCTRARGLPPQHEIDGWIANQELLPLTPHTIVHPEPLRIEIGVWPACRVAGIAGVAAPVAVK
jgi:hypothetical protein